MYSGGLFVNYSRVFDSIDHSILAGKLKIYGFEETPQKFMKDYMVCRKQMTIVNGHSLPPAGVIYSAAQGSIYSVLKFSFYMLMTSLSP